MRAKRTPANATAFDRLKNIRRKAKELGRSLLRECRTMTPAEMARFEKWKVELASLRVAVRAGAEDEPAPAVASV